MGRSGPEGRGETRSKQEVFTVLYHPIPFGLGSLIPVGLERNDNPLKKEDVLHLNVASSQLRAKGSRESIGEKFS